MTFEQVKTEIIGGLLHEWQVRNRTATVPHTIEQLRSAGNVDNLKRLLVADAPPYRGRYPFLDTDLYKTLEGVAYEIGAGTAPDEAREFFDEVVELLARVQAEDGYLNSFFQDPACAKKPWEDLSWGHELYNLGHLIQAAVAARRRMGDGRLLSVAVKFADLVVEKFGPGKEEAVCGHPEVEMALVELYRETGDRAYLVQAGLFVDRRGRGKLKHTIFPPEYFQDHLPFRELPTVTGHAVRMTYLAAGAADIYLETGDRSLFETLDRLWDDMVATKLYITGGLGSRHSDEAIGDRYELPSERAYAETCAAIATMQWAWRMFQATGGAKYLDVFEQVLFNAYAVGLSADGRAFFYDNPLQRRPDHEQRSGAETGGEMLRRSWFGCPCCPPNIVRWMAQLGDYVAAERDGALHIATYAGALIETDAIALTMETEYPWDGAVRIVVERASNEPYAIRLRVPAWARSATASVNGRPVEGAEDGWLTVERVWAAGDELRFDLPMPVRAHGSHPHLDATRGAVGVARGPLVYCVEQQDCPVSVDDLILSRQQIVNANIAKPEVGTPGAVVLRVTGGVAPPPSAELYPELPAEQTAPGRTVPVTFVAHFLWGNRRPEAMRVWVRNA
ncbi:glycoside hydrolase family 127 protein [Streptosporangium sp. NBC_01639]|uniref:glycoside hydrolase family 127 protein n=1 Tax=Streptosporangium sp. NBC_01639 TaxID=2975948 RepID=UPI003866F076|nr:glycoside hydrolase family 127 protein [Streptosporangium sp. NBC_01639]